MTVNDFSLAKGDTLTIDQSLKGATKFASDGHGGTMVSFGTATLGRIDLVDGRSGRAHREKQIWFGVATCCGAAPVVCIPVDCPIPHESHWEASTHAVVILFT